MLNDAQCRQIEEELIRNVEPRKVAAYLSLSMGLSLAEVSGLRVEDIDIPGKRLAIKNVMLRPEGAMRQSELVVVPSDNPRVLFIPDNVQRFLLENIRLYPTPDSFIITGNTKIPVPYMMQNILTSVARKTKVADDLALTDLRNGFILRCIHAGIDLYTICWQIGIHQPMTIIKKFPNEFKPKPESLAVLEQCAWDYVKTEPRQDYGPKRMNLLILGAGGHGHAVKETAEGIGIFEDIAFLDDNTTVEGVIDKLFNYKEYLNSFPVAFVALGDNKLRRTLIEGLEESGFIVPVLRHPSATISPTATIDVGTFIAAKVIIGANATIGKGNIIAGACVLDHNVILGDYVHTDVGVMVTKDSRIDDMAKVPTGTVVSNG